MYIEELKVGEELESAGDKEQEENKSYCGRNEVLGIGRSIAEWDARRVLVGAGARALFYPTLLYNLVRNKIQTEFRWWDRVDEFILLGAVPFPTDVPRLKGIGVGGVITLNEPYETLVPTSLYHNHGINHLVIPTRDYCFAPSLTSICRAIDFIHKNASHGQTTYVHCKAGRGRSTTIVLCYLVYYKQMTPAGAYDYVKSIRPRVRLASSQWQAVEEFYNLKMRKVAFHSHAMDLIVRTSDSASSQDLVTFDDGSVVVVTEADIDGYDQSLEPGATGSRIWADLSVVYRVRVVGQAALARISCLWLSCQAHQKISAQELAKESTCLGRTISVDIHVY
ncbi:putative dual specificity protein phosphatase DSP8 [Hibiscus syriacus]|uniref:phosphatidylglycerophosphatase n=1 Tax=Hibiscus syriacus TaxID=106335 RepID=A0A6A2ZQP2_HIBSY|nr:phosphatidylglycerophosphate phosphatase PTPMT1-like [Hibiscus syriacus]KAE8693896.1 putative dual specificity protein phosphatase DSP8 [Hibiscus syriacus]